MQDFSAIVNLFDKTELFILTDFNNPPVQYKGANRAGVLVLCASSSLAADEQEMLGKMLNALKLDWDDVALVCAEQSAALTVLKKQIVFNRLVSFGFGAADLGLNIETGNYQLIRVGDVKIVFSEPLDLLKENRDSAKDRLWRALKEMFL